MGAENSESFSLFGGGQNIKAESAVYGLIVTIVIIGTLESMFHVLHDLTNDTTFQELVSAVEKELMIVGSMAFVFKIILNSDTELSTETNHAFEFSGN